MHPDVKTFLKWAGFVLALALAWFLGSRANAQTTGQATTEQGVVLTLGPVDTVYHWRNQAAWPQDVLYPTDEWGRSPVGQIASRQTKAQLLKDAGIEVREPSDPVTFVPEDAKNIEWLGDPYTSYLRQYDQGEWRMTFSGYEVRTGEPAYAMQRIGKAYSPRLAFLDAPEVASGVFHGGPTFEGLFTDLFIPYGLIVVMLGVILILFIAS